MLLLNNFFQQCFHDCSGELLWNIRDLSLNDVTESNGQNVFFLFLCCIEAGDFLIPETACVYKENIVVGWRVYIFVHLKMLFCESAHVK